MSSAFMDNIKAGLQTKKRTAPAPSPLEPAKRSKVIEDPGSDLEMDKGVDPHIVLGAQLRTKQTIRKSVGRMPAGKTLRNPYKGSPKDLAAPSLLTTSGSDRGNDDGGHGNENADDGHEDANELNEKIMQVQASEDIIKSEIRKLCGMTREHSKLVDAITATAREVTDEFKEEEEAPAAKPAPANPAPAKAAQRGRSPSEDPVFAQEYENIITPSKLRNRQRLQKNSSDDRNVGDAALAEQGSPSAGRRRASHSAKR